MPDPLTDLHTGSDANLKIARRWLDECDRNHTACVSSQGPPVLPSRVIDVSSAQPFLYQSDGKCERYTILSHCWGKQQIITTKLGDLETRLKEVSLASMSKTFREAVEITRRLGLRYLWIDSLCIIQDSIRDWEVESFKMGAYYKSAYVTISASGADDGTVGCFLARNPASIQPILLSIRLHQAKESIQVISRQPYFKVAPRRPTSLGMSRLDRRAWCLQESIMSPRLLKFGHHQLEWACNTKLASENDVSGSFNSVSDQVDSFCPLVELQAQLSYNGPLSKHNFWFDIVGQYTRRQLSHISDMLPALSGIVANIQQLTGDIYLAGIWKSDLARGLLWRTPCRILRPRSPSSTRIDIEDWRDVADWEAEFNSKHPQRSDSYHAPSWSWACINNCFADWDLVFDWASIDNDVVYGDDLEQSKHGESCFNLQSAFTVPAGQNPFGQVTDGKLILEGRIKKAEVRYWDLYYADNLVDPESGASIGKFDVDEVTSCFETVFCLPILRRKLRYDDEGEDGESRVVGLAVELVDSSLQIFKRVGVISTRSWEWFRDTHSRTLTMI
ncbi:hypothetical protein EG329_002652 [Mollisiaceae sp. DMI_Dod_QoI]|nr:hypothetical protein EG329_002652 [Helotiales sp. DMI_Dod_QoI]